MPAEARRFPSRRVTGQPIKFVGTGEKVDALEPFFPDRLAGRILGMGDVLSLIEKAEETVDQEQAAELAEKIRKDEFTLDDFRDQLKQIRKMGPLDQILGMLPNMGPLRGMNKMKVDEKELIHIEAIINSMTAEERNHHKILNGKQAQADCARQRAPGSRDQSVAETICGNPQNDAKSEPGHHAAHDEGYEISQA